MENGRKMGFNEFCAMMDSAVSKAQGLPPSEPVVPVELSLGSRYRIGGRSYECTRIGPKVTFKSQTGKIMRGDIENVVKEGLVGKHRIWPLTPNAENGDFMEIPSEG